MIKLFEKQARVHKNKTALVYQKKILTYGELNKKANQLAYHLRTQGVHNDCLVAVALPRSPEMLIAFLAILKVGGAYLALDCTYPKERLQFMLQDSKASILLTTSKTFDIFKNYQGKIVKIEDELLFSGNSINSSYSTLPNNLAYILYTSGSTGVPKGVMIEHGSLNNYLYHALKSYPLPKHKRGVLLHSSIAFDLTVTSIFLPLIQGGIIYIMPEGSNVEHLAQEININKGIGLLKITPSHLKALKKHINFEHLEDITLIIGGEKLLKSDVNPWLEVKGIKIFNEYGPTEATVGCMVFELHKNNLPFRFIPIGQPIHNTKIYLLDKDQRLILKGEIGEIYIAGLGLARGYLNREDLTKEKFISNPFLTKKEQKFNSNLRLYSTGDLGRSLPDGNYEFLGRKDDQVKIKGYRIELQEIEAIVNSHNDILNSYITTFTDSNIKKLVAYIVPGDFTPSEIELREFLEPKLPDYMIPSFFIYLDNIPLNINGKIDKKALPLPNLNYLNNISLVQEEFCSPLEQNLKEIWMEVLKVKSLGIHNNFYRVGGDSIISLQLVAKARQKGLHFTVQDIFNNPTISTLALKVTNKTNLPITNLSQESNFGLVPLSPIQIWFFQHNFPNKNHFNQAILLTAKLNIDESILNQALSIIIDNHNALKFRYYQNSRKEWQQEIIKTKNNFVCEVIDLSFMPKDKISEAIHFYNNKAQKELNIAQGKLIKTLLFYFGENKPQQILIIIHHLVVDTVSWRVLVEDLEKAYMTLLEKNINIELHKSSSYRQWVSTILNYSSSEELQQEKLYWQKIGKNTVPITQDFNLGSLSNKCINSITILLTKEKTLSLLHKTNRAYNTQINDILLTALVLAIGDWNHNYSLSFCLEGHGREEHIVDKIDLSKTVGWFTSLFPVNLSIADPANLGKAIKEIKESLRAIPSKGIGYSLINYSEHKSFFYQSTRPNLSFNYLGQWDNLVSENSLFYFADEVIIECASKDNAPFFPIEINAEVKNNILSILWTYSTNHFKYETIEKIAHSFKLRLHQLIEHCYQESTFGYTPSDFKLANLTQAEIDEHFSLIPNVEDIYPLSPMQFGILFHSLYAPQSKNYFVQTIFKITGEINKAVLQQACKKICDIHPILRTGFIFQNLNDPIQYVVNSLPMELIFENWENLSLAEQQVKLDEFLLIAQEKGFNLTRLPLFCLTLIQTSNNSYYFCISQHHILLDGWSSSLILNDLFAIYETIKQQKQHTITSSRPLFRHYIEWQSKQQETEEVKKFWQTYLEPLEDVTYLGFKDLVKEKFTKEYDMNFLRLSQTENKKIINFTSKNNITINTLILAAVAITLENYIPQQELVIGITVSGRNPELEGVEDMAGLLINTLPLRINKNSSLTIFEFLKKLQDTVQLINKYSYLPLAKVQTLANTDRHLFNTIFVFEKHPLDRTSFSDFEIKEFIGIENTEYPLTITALQSKTIDIILNYQTKLFNKNLTDRILKNILHVLWQIVQNKDASISEIDPLSPEEKAKIIIEWSNAKNVVPNNGTLNELFEQQAKAMPDNIAIVCKGKTLSYKALNDKANQLARHLKTKNVTKETFVVIFCERSFDMITGILAVLKAGGAYIPIDSTYPKETLLHILNDSKASILLTQKNFTQNLPKLNAEIVCLDTNEFIDYPINNLPIVNDQNNLAYIIYTSGSTGKPKGVMVEHISACARLAAYQDHYPLTFEDVVLCQTSISFDVSIAELFWPFSIGAKVVLSTEKSYEHLIELEDLIYKHKVTFAQFVPSVLKIFLIHLDKNKSYSLKCVCSGGEVLEYKVAQDFSKKLPNTKLQNAYGPTETTIDATIYNYNNSSSKITTFVPIGRPLGNTTAYILNESMQPVPICVTGEIYLGGAGVARGYLSNKTLTDKNFIKNPFILATNNANKNYRLYKTGDLGRWLEDGTLEYIGRKDNQIKIRGFRVELQEIEEVLLNNFSIENAIVVIKEDIAGNKKLIAYIVSKNKNFNFNEMRNILGNLLPSHMIPNDFISLSSFPLTDNGKIDRKKIASIKNIVNKEQLILPRTELEKILCNMWEHLLNLKQIGIQDNFFFLGGNSILATQLILRLKKKFKCNLSFTAFFNEPTIENLAKVLSNQNLEETNQNILDQIQRDINSAQIFSNNKTHIQPYKLLEPNILLTGASGFLGVHLLEEITHTTKGKIYCLLRGENENIAIERFEKNLKYYNLEHLKYNKQVIPILGDLAKPKLGLTNAIYNEITREVTDIYHNGALVHHIYDYSRLQKVNVQSTITILEIAALCRPKTIHFISTLSTGFDKNDKGQIIEGFVKTYPMGNEGGYTLSKWASEKILADSIVRGFKTTIHRLPQIMGNSVSGASPSDKTHIMLLMKNWIELGIAPKDMGNFEILPVDFAAKCIVQICHDEESLNKVFNFGHPTLIPFNQIIGWLNEFGYKIDLVNIEEWQQRCTSYVQEDSALYPLLSLYINAEKQKEDNSKSRTGYREDSVITNNMQEFTRKRDLTLPALNKELFFRYFSYLQSWFDS